MTPADEPTPTDDATEETTVEDTETESGDDEGVEAEATLLEKSQAAIDDAHEAVKKVAATDAIGEDATGAGDLPAFADSTEDAEKPDPDNA
jgi:hypothetical protein